MGYFEATFSSQNADLMMILLGGGVLGDLIALGDPREWGT